MVKGTKYSRSSCQMIMKISNENIYVADKRMRMYRSVCFRRATFKNKSMIRTRNTTWLL